MNLRQTVTVKFVLLIVVCLLLVALTEARVLTSTSDLTASYDFVIVGGKQQRIGYMIVQNPAEFKYSLTGGTAGSVIATRLAAISNVSILVIEAGGRCARSFL